MRVHVCVGMTARFEQTCNMHVCVAVPRLKLQASKSDKA